MRNLSIFAILVLFMACQSPLSTISTTSKNPDSPATTIPSASVLGKAVPRLFGTDPVSKVVAGKSASRMITMPNTGPGGAISINDFSKGQLLGTTPVLTGWSTGQGSVNNGDVLNYMIFGLPITVTVTVDPSDGKTTYDGVFADNQSRIKLVILGSQLTIDEQIVVLQFDSQFYTEFYFKSHTDATITSNGSYSGSGYLYKYVNEQDFAKFQGATYGESHSKVLLDDNGDLIWAGNLLNYFQSSAHTNYPGLGLTLNPFDTAEYDRLVEEARDDVNAVVFPYLIYGTPSAWLQDYTDHLMDRWNSITVPDPVLASSVNLNTGSLALVVGDTSSLVATVLPVTTVDKFVTWTSSDPLVASVSSSGLVTALDIGSATITVTSRDGNWTSTCNVVVSAVVGP